MHLVGPITQVHERRKPRAVRLPPLPDPAPRHRVCARAVLCRAMLRRFVLCCAAPHHAALCCAALCCAALRCSHRYNCMRKSQNVVPSRDRSSSALLLPARPPPPQVRRHDGRAVHRLHAHGPHRGAARVPTLHVREAGAPTAAAAGVTMIAASSAAHSAMPAATAHTSTVWRSELLVRAATAQQSMRWGSQILFPHSFLVNNLAEVLPYSLGIPLKPNPRPRQRSKRNSRARGIAAGVSAALCRHRLRLGLADTRAARAAGGRVRVRMFQLAL